MPFGITKKKTYLLSNTKSLIVLKMLKILRPSSCNLQRFDAHRK